MNKKNIVPIGIIAIVVIALAVLIVKPWQGSTPENPALEAFGECLASKGATMYGAYWCPHCQDEKKALGAGMKKVTYVECTEQTALCAEKGIQGYPTWILGDGTRLEGQQGIEGLSRATGCPAPAAQ
jgi:hypothetical protein